MSSRDDYSVDDWKAISTAPAAAGLAILLSDRARSIGIAEALVIVGEVIGHSALRDVPEIVKVLVESIRRQNGRPDRPELSTGHREEAMTALIGIVQAAVHAVATQSPAEGEPFKTWLAAVAARAFHAAEAKALSGANFTSASHPDQQTIDRLADVLGVSAGGGVGSAPRTKSAVAARMLSQSKTPNRKEVCHVIETVDRDHHHRLVTLAANASVVEDSPAEITKNSQDALASLYAKVDGAKALGASAHAILVFPKVTKAGLGIGGQHGEGALLKGGKAIGYYKTTGASVGLQAGAQTYGYAIFMNDAALKQLDKADGFEIGVGPTIVVMDEGKAKNMTTTTAKVDICAFVFGQKGLMAGPGIQGNRISKFEPK
jgi:lipid-binding SYLF domain-containing protein